MFSAAISTMLISPDEQSPSSLMHSRACLLLSTSHPPGSRAAPGLAALRAGAHPLRLRLGLLHAGESLWADLGDASVARADPTQVQPVPACSSACLSRFRTDPVRHSRDPTLPPLVVLVKKKGTTSGLRSANLQSGGYGGWRPRFSSFAGRRRQVRGRWGAGCLKSLAPEEHFSRFPAARLRGRAVPCAARCGAAAMRSSFRLFVRPNGLFLFFRITLSVQRFLRPGEQT